MLGLLRLRAERWAPKDCLRAARLPREVRPPSSFAETPLMALLRLAYVSTSAIAGAPRERESIADIRYLRAGTTRRPASPVRCWPPTTASRRCWRANRRLWRETYARITRDRRHVDIVLLLKESVAERHFPQIVDGFYRALPTGRKKRWRG